MSIKKKHYILAIFLIISMAQPTYAGNSMSSLVKKNKEHKEDKKEERELAIAKFNFAELPEEQIREAIVEYAWNSQDNEKQFEQDLLNWKNIRAHAEENEITSKSEMRRYGFYGKKLPIYFYTLQNGNPAIMTVGNILVDAIPHWAKASVNDGTLTQLILHGPNNTLYSVAIKDADNSRVDVTSACFSVLGDVAITWKRKNRYDFIALFHVDNIKDEKEIDLNVGAISVEDINKHCEKKVLFGKEEPYYFEEVKRNLFNLGGNELGICMKKPGTQCVTIDFRGGKSTSSYSNPESNYLAVIRMPLSCDEPLTVAEKAKRLGIATKGSKELIGKRLLESKVSNKNN